MLRKLLKEEKQRLIALHRKERCRKVGDRIKAILLCDAEYSYAEIASILLLDDETIRRHVKDYFEKNKLAPENGGSASYLDKIQTEQLRHHLQEVTYLSAKEICNYVKQTFNLHYSISGITKWLHHNNFTYKKPHAVPAKADKKDQKQFVSYYEQLKVNVAQKEPIYFADSVHPEHQTRLAYGWIIKGERKEIPTTGRQKRLNFIGGICLNGHKFIYQQSDKVNKESISLFLHKLRKRHQDKNHIHIIWDNAGYHRSKDIQALAKKLLIKLHYLPPYSPNLNPIERMWKIMHEQVTYNKYYENFHKFTQAIITFFKTIGRKKCALRTRITDNFQILHSPLIAS